jgi:hypothetical protein
MDYVQEMLGIESKFEFSFVLGVTLCETYPIPKMYFFHVHTLFRRKIVDLLLSSLVKIFERIAGTMSLDETAAEGLLTRLVSISDYIEKLAFVFTGLMAKSLERILQGEEEGGY